MDVNKCCVKSCKVNPALHDLFLVPEEPNVLKRWQEALLTTETDFYVCDHHFEKKYFEKNLTDDAVPALHLSDEIIKLENDCCGLCLKVTDDKFKISSDLGCLFKEISEYETLTEFICKPCHFGLTKYRQFQTTIKLKHSEIRNAARNPDTDDSDDCVISTPIINYEPKIPPTKPVPLPTVDLKKCKICNKFTANKNENIFKHVLDHHSFSCDPCAFNCASGNMLEKHILADHIKRSIYKCGICNLNEFLDPSILDLHLQYIHGKNVFDCLKCKSRFSNADHLRVHVVLKHQVHFKDSSKQPPRQLPTINRPPIPQKQPPRQNLPIIKHVASIAPIEIRRKQLPTVKVIHPAVIKPLPTVRKLEARVQTIVSRIKKKITPRRDELSNWTEDTPVVLEQVNLIETLPIKMEMKQEEVEQNEIVINDSEYSTKSSNDDSTEESDDDDDEMEEEKPFDETAKNSTGKIFVTSMPPIVESTLPYIEEKEPSLLNKDHVKCLECQRSFENIIDLFNHRKEEHNFEVVRKYGEFPPEIKEKKPEKEKDLKVACEFCFIKVYEKNLEKHIDEEHSNKPKIFLCHVCSNAFSTQKNLTSHLYKHNKKYDYECDLCGQKFYRKDRVKRHLERSHLIIKRYKVQCQICLQKLTKRTKIFRHMKLYHKDGYDCGSRTNSETNWFDCEKCGASYIDLFTFRRHDCEKGRFQIRCPECMRPLKNHENLKKHLENKCRKLSRWHSVKGTQQGLTFNGYGGVS